MEGCGWGDGGEGVEDGLDFGEGAGEEDEGCGVGGGEGGGGVGADGVCGGAGDEDCVLLVGCCAEWREFGRAETHKFSP